MTNFEIKMENVVANARIANELDLQYIDSRLEGAKFTKKRFPGLVYQVKKPKAAFLVFRSGKVVCTGSRSFEELRVVMNTLAADLRSIGINVQEQPDFKVQNIVASANLGVELNLSAIAIGLGLEGMEYEPEVFPGLVYRVAELDSAILIFSSGKLVITGCRTKEECERAVGILLKDLKNLGQI